MEKQTEEKPTINTYSNSLIPNLQDVMKSVGFDIVLRETYNPTLISFLHMLLLCVSERLHHLKSITNKEVTDEEKLILKQLMKESESPDTVSKLRAVLDNFNIKLPQYMHYLMLKVGLSDSDMKDLNKVLNF